MLKAVRDTTPSEGDRHPDAAPGDKRPCWPAFPRMVEEDHGSPFGFRTRRIPDPPELTELTEIAIRLGNPRAV
jgi:hypothetical protein